MPNQFQRGFEGFGRAIPIRGMTPPAPLRIVQPGAKLGSVQAPEPAPAAPPPAPEYAPEQSRPTPPGRFKIYKKGEPGAPPCPVCH
jgi:hypothetical protein